MRKDRTSSTLSGMMYETLKTSIKNSLSRSTVFTNDILRTGALVNQNDKKRRWSKCFVIDGKTSSKKTWNQ